MRVSSRYGVKEYHRPTWPRRTKCKEGNLAYFYDHWGYRDYDVVVQLDADHVPAADYLQSMVRPFVSEQVGYVAAPSICDANARESWAARGRLYKDALLHGATQAGCNEGFAPICHGSHYAVRTAALREIGGIGPELAEDFTTSFLLTAAGWEGAFAIDAEAHGEGPPTFRALLIQEFQWSQSISLVGLRLFFQNIRRFPWKLRIRFGMVLLFYPMLVITTVTGHLSGPHRRGDRRAVDARQLAGLLRPVGPRLGAARVGDRGPPLEGCPAPAAGQGPQLGVLAVLLRPVAVRLLRVLRRGERAASFPSRGPSR